MALNKTPGQSEKMGHNQVKTKPERSVHSVLSHWHAGRITQTKPVQFCMDSWGIWIWHVGSCRWQEYQDVHVLPLGAQPLEKGKLLICSRLQMTRIASVRHLKAFTLQPPAGLKYLCWKAAEQILGNSDYPLSREWRGLAHAQHCGVTGLLSLALSPCPLQSHSFHMANMHCGFLPCFPTNASSFPWKTRRDFFISVSSLSQ